MTKKLKTGLNVYMCELNKERKKNRRDSFDNFIEDLYPLPQVLDLIIDSLLKYNDDWDEPCTTLSNSKNYGQKLPHNYKRK